MKKTNTNYKTNVVYILAIATVAVLVFNQLQLTGMATMQTPTTPQATQQTSQSSISFEEAASKVIPRGVPEIYGSELGVSFEDPINSLNTLALLDGDLYETGTLRFSDLQADAQMRYIKIGSQISCEYCCGATTLVFSNGDPACGCAHSAAMRGLTKYLLINHNYMSDQAILDELVKWKSMFFPKQMIERYIETNGGTLEYSGLPDMVGGC